MFQTLTSASVEPTEMDSSLPSLCSSSQRNIDDPEEDGASKQVVVSHFGSCLTLFCSLFCLNHCNVDPQWQIWYIGKFYQRVGIWTPIRFLI